MGQDRYYRIGLPSYIWTKFRHREVSQNKMSPTVNKSNNGTYMNISGIYIQGGPPVYTLNGNMAVSGSFSASSKSFDIPHPDPAKLALGYRLRHACVEAPTRGENMYRFKVQTATLAESFVIELPAYFTHLNEDAQVFVTSVDVQSDACADVVYDDAGGATVRGICQLPGRYNVLVIATRKDAFAISGFDGTGVEYVV